MSRFALAFTIGLVFTSTGCSTVQVATEYKQGVDYKRYRTFAWNPVDPGPEQAVDARDPAIRKLVFSTIEARLVPRGFQRVEAGANPDFFIAVHGWSRDKIDVKQYGYVYGYTGYGMYATGGPAVEVRQYKEGTITIDFIDAAAKEMFWRGIGSDTFIPGTGAAVVKEAITKVLDAYPPPR